MRDLPPRVLAHVDAHIRSIDAIQVLIRDPFRLATADLHAAPQASR
jgi:hypothetical protein